MLKKWELSVLIGLVITITLSTVSFTAQCEDIRSRVLRLHILANSDSSEDQALKLKVRDRLLVVGKDLFSGSSNALQAKDKANDEIQRLQKAAQEVIKSEGYSYPVKIEIAKTDFETRTYDNVTLPAGQYDAVRVLIGEAKGQNWWCVMFPPMCIPAAQPEPEIEDVLTDSETDIVVNKNKYQIQFKLVEWYEKIKSKYAVL